MAAPPPHLDFWSSFLAWFDHHAGLAAWLQGLGSTGAIWFLALSHYSNQVKDRRLRAAAALDVAEGLDDAFHASDNALMVLNRGERLQATSFEARLLRDVYETLRAQPQTELSEKDARDLQETIAQLKRALDQIGPDGVAPEGWARDVFGAVAWHLDRVRFRRIIRLPLLHRWAFWVKRSVRSA